MPDDLPGLDDPNFFTLPGCASLFGIFMGVLGIAAGVFFVLTEYTDGLLLVIIFMLAALLAVVATKAR